MQRILANDGLDNIAVKLFEQANIEVDTKKKSPIELVREIGNYDALLVRSSTKVTREIIESGKDRLKLVGRAGVGYDNVDIHAANDNYVVVKFAPHGNTTSTAEQALGLMFAVSRNIPQSHYTLKNGVWQKKSFKGHEISGKTLGIIGTGRIGQKLSDLVRGLDMKVLGFDLYPNTESRIDYTSMDDLLQRSDYISIHTGGNIQVIGKREFDLMKTTAFLINASRGKNVNPDDLYHALTTKQIAGAALDTYIGEPKIEGAEFSNRFRELDNVVMTSHLGASTYEAQRRTALEMAEVTIDFFNLGSPTNAVNVTQEVEQEGLPIYRMDIGHMDRPGIFGEINTLLGENGINIRTHPSRKIGENNQVLTTYSIHQPVSKTMRTQLMAIAGVGQVRVYEKEITTPK